MRLLLLLFLTKSLMVFTQIKDASVCNAAYGEPHYNERNFGDNEYLINVSWTASAHGVDQFDWFTYISDDDLEKNWKKLDSVSLTLHKRYGHKYFGGGQVGSKILRAYPVVEKWKEDKVTWDTKPRIDSKVYIEINPDLYDEVLTIDLTDVLKNYEGKRIYGFAILLKDFEVNRSCLFYSSNSVNEEKKPKFKYVLDN